MPGVGRGEGTSRNVARSTAVAGDPAEAEELDIYVAAFDDVQSIRTFNPNDR